MRIFTRFSGCSMSIGLTKLFLKFEFMKTYNNSYVLKTENLVYIFQAFIKTAQ